MENKDLLENVSNEELSQDLFELVKKDENKIHDEKFKTKATTFAKDAFKRFCKNYKVDKKTEKIVSLLILNHDRDIPSKRSSMIKYLQEFNHTNLNLLFKLQKADILAQNPLYHKELLKKLAEGKNRLEKLQDEKPVLSIKELAITGNDLIQLGYHDKEIGIIKEKILMEVINNQLNNDKESIIKYINNNI